MKKKLFILVGAGASVDFGIPSVWDINNKLVERAKVEFPIEHDDGDLYSFFMKKINKFYNSKEATYEEILYNIEILASIYCPKNSWSPSSYNRFAQLIEKTIDIPQIQITDKSICTLGCSEVDSNTLYSFCSCCIDNIVGYIIDKCQLVDKYTIKILYNFIKTIKDKFDPYIFSLNHDDLFIQADQHLFTGFNDNNFAYKEIMNRKNGNFIYYLHGSIHFKIQDKESNLIWDEKLIMNNQSTSFARKPIKHKEGYETPISPIIAGYAKTNQIIRQPFRTFFVKANESINDADAVLFIGYGFSDYHINSIFSDLDDKIPIVIIDFTPKGKRIPFKKRTDEWSTNLRNTLQLKNIPDISDDELQKDYILEKIDINRNIFIWYKGFFEACLHPEYIIPTLFKSVPPSTPAT